MWNTFLILSVISLCLALVTAIALYCAVKEKRGQAFFWTLAVGVAVSVTLVFIPYYYNYMEGLTNRTLKTLLMSFHNTIRLFVVDGDYGFIIENAANIPEEVKGAYTAYTAGAFIAPPLFTFGFILSIFQNLIPCLQLCACAFKDVYVFSSLNKKSMALAKSLKEQGKAIVFCGVKKDDESLRELLEEADKLRAICLKKDASSLKFRLHSFNKELWFFEIGDDEVEKLDDSARIIERFGKNENVRLYIFSITAESELLLSAVTDKKIKVRRIDENLCVINNEISQNGVKNLFENAKEIQGQEEKKISAVIVGMGGYGTEMLKTLLWYCQMDGYRIQIDVFDSDEKAKDKFTAQCPEIMSEKYNGVYVEGEAQYFVDIHSGLQVEELAFANEIQKLTDTTYVLVSLGEDELNVKTAKYLRMLFERMKIKPIIQTVVYSGKMAKNLAAAKNFKGDSYGIEFIGDFESVYTKKTVVNSDLEERAIAIHRKYGTPVEEFWQQEYNYRSSMASALHNQARIACGIRGAGKKEADLTEEERLIIELLEHRRWNAYMRTQGYVFSGSKEKSSRNDLGKMHHDLVDFDSLSEEDKRKDSRVGSD